MPKVARLFAIAALAFLVVPMGCARAESVEQNAETGSASGHTLKKKVIGMKGAPSVDIVITTGVAGDDDLARGVYIFHVKCSNSCDLDLTMLNQCSANKGGAVGFIPRIENWNTLTDTMTARPISKNQLELVVYQAFEHLLPAKVILTFDSAGDPFKSLIGFETSGFIDLSVWPNSLTRISLVPVPSDRLKSLDCPVFLPGLRHSQ